MSMNVKTPLPEQVKVLVFHSHGVGQTVRMPALPREGETVWTQSWEIGDDCAKGSNVATALARLGIKTALFSKVGTDLWGNIGLDPLINAGVNLDYLLRSADVQTLIGMVIVDDKAQNSIILGGGCASFTEYEIQQALSRFCNASIFITGFEIQPKSALLGAKLAHSRGLLTVLNASPLGNCEVPNLDFIDILIINEPECAALLSARQLDWSADAHKNAQQILQSYQPGFLVMTLGNKGCIGAGPREQWTLAPIPVRAVDTSGAGDAFLAAMCAGLASGKDAYSACQCANQYAARSVCLPGTVPSFLSLNQLGELALTFRPQEKE